jgi:hypothetical protein
MRKILLGTALVLVVCAAWYFQIHHAKQPIETAYAGNKQVTLMNTTAQVRAPVGTVNFGDRLSVLERFQDQVKVRTANGVVGWVYERDLLSADLWQKTRDMAARTDGMAVMARGHTRVLTNLRIAPGRDMPRIRQLTKAVPVLMYERQAVEVPVAAGAARASDQDDNSAEPPMAKKEDWWLVRAHTDDKMGISGWLLGRFVEPEVPAPLPDYASSAGMRIIGWFELSRVNDSSGRPKPQYLVVGAHGAEGQACDFTMLRVFTWGVQRQRYETAFVEGNVCGKLPVKVTAATTAGGDATFAFQDAGSTSSEQRTYRMHQTIVRRVRADGSPAPRKHR